MSQKHVDLLMEAVNLDCRGMEYLCNKIMIIASDVPKAEYYNQFRNTKYSEKDYEALKKLINDNINDNLENSDEDCNTFYNTTFYYNNFTRKEWAETILAPLALELEEG
jgi:hypothetical protein